MARDGLPIHSVVNCRITLHLRDDLAIEIAYVCVVKERWVTIMLVPRIAFSQLLFFSHMTLIRVIDTWIVLLFTLTRWLVLIPSSPKLKLLFLVCIVLVLMPILVACHLMMGGYWQLLVALFLHIIWVLSILWSHLMSCVAFYWRSVSTLDIHSTLRLTVIGACLHLSYSFHVLCGEWIGTAIVCRIVCICIIMRVQVHHILLACYCIMVTFKSFEKSLFNQI